MRVVFATVLFALVCACSSPEPVETVETTTAPATDVELLATFYPTPEPVVERMLQAAELKPGEVHFDLGSGDGRIVIQAAEVGANSVGFEINPDLIAESRDRIQRAGLEHRAKILSQDLLTAEFASADVITAFLTPEAYVKLEPVLREEVRPDVRVVAYKFPVPSWEPDEVITMVDSDPEIPTHEIFVYRGPPGSGD